MLDKSAGRIERELADHPEVRATMMDVIGQVYYSLGLYDRALPLLGNALDTHRRLLGEAHPDVASSHAALGSVLQDMREYPGAEKHLLTAAQLERYLDNFPLKKLASTLNSPVWLFNNVGDLQKAQRYYRAMLSSWETFDNKNDLKYDTLLNNFGLFLHEKSNYAESEAIYRKQLALLHTTAGRRAGGERS